MVCRGSRQTLNPVLIERKENSAIESRSNTWYRDFSVLHSHTTWIWSINYHTCRGMPSTRQLCIRGRGLLLDSRAAFSDNGWYLSWQALSAFIIHLIEELDCFIQVMTVLVHMREHNDQKNTSRTLRSAVFEMDRPPPSESIVVQFQWMRYRQSSIPWCIVKWSLDWWRYQTHHPPWRFGSTELGEIARPSVPNTFRLAQLDKKIEISPSTSW